MTVHLFGATSSPSCPAFCLRHVVDIFGADYSTEARDTIRRNFYVDDCLVSVLTKEKAVVLIEEVSEMLKRAGFNLTKWVCNKEHVLQNVQENKRTTTIKSVPTASTADERVLGINWNVATDEFRVKTKLASKLDTRRGVLSMSHSFFDPMVFIVPVLLEPKLPMRELSEREWDVALKSDEVERWEFGSSRCNTSKILKLIVALNQGFPTCGTRTTGGTRKLFKWYARDFPKMQKKNRFHGILPNTFVLHN